MYKNFTDGKHGWKQAEEKSLTMRICKFQGFFFVIVFLGVTIFCDKKIDWSVLFSSLLTLFLL